MAKGKPRKTAQKTAKKPVKKIVKKTARKAAKGAAKAKAAPKKNAPKKAPPKKSIAGKSPAKKTAAKKAAGKTATKAVSKAVRGPRGGVPPRRLPPTRRAPSVALDQLFTPLDDRVLVEPTGAAERTAGGLYIPAMVQERPSQGRVVAVGRGARRKKGGVRPLDVRLGDQVLFGAYVGQKLVLGGRDVIVLKEEDILGVVKG